MRLRMPRSRRADAADVGTRGDAGGGRVPPIPPSEAVAAPADRFRNMTNTGGSEASPVPRGTRGQVASTDLAGRRIAGLASGDRRPTPRTAVADRREQRRHPRILSRRPLGSGLRRRRTEARRGCRGRPGCACRGQVLDPASSQEVATAGGRSGSRMLRPGSRRGPPAPGRPPGFVRVTPEGVSGRPQPGKRGLAAVRSGAGGEYVVPGFAAVVGDLPPGGGMRSGPATGRPGAVAHRPEKSTGA